MRSINRGLLVLSFLMVPLGAAAQSPGEEARANIEESASTEIHSQTLRSRPMQTAQTTSATAGSSETTLSVKSLLDAKVLGFDKP